MTRSLSDVVKAGQFPKLSLRTVPVEASRQPAQIDHFLSYKFDSNILVPSDSFSFSFASQLGNGPNESIDTAYDIMKDGDVLELYGNDTLITKGILDVMDVEISAEKGEHISVAGRDFLGQLEDHTAISVQDAPLYGANDIKTVMKWILKNTRMDSQKVAYQDAPSGKYLFAPEPGESKMSALQRFLEPLNCLVWLEPNGVLKIGRPDMRQSSSGDFICSRSQRYSNVLSIKVTRASTRIPNIIVPILSSQQENPEAAIDPALQVWHNAALRPSQLYNAKHYVIRAVPVSIPNGTSPIDLAYANSVIVFTGSRFETAEQITQANQSSSLRRSAEIFQGYASREAARANMDELKVQVLVPGHYNQDGKPYKADSVYNILCDRGNVNEEMYCYGVSYQLDPTLGQTTVLDFVKKGTIVSGVRAQ